MPFLIHIQGAFAIAQAEDAVILLKYPHSGEFPWESGLGGGATRDDLMELPGR
jgi:hypothetical protein